MRYIVERLKLKTTHGIEPRELRIALLLLARQENGSRVWKKLEKLVERAQSTLARKHGNLVASEQIKHLLPGEKIVRYRKEIALVTYRQDGHSNGYTLRLNEYPTAYSSDSRLSIGLGLSSSDLTLGAWVIEKPKTAFEKELVRLSCCSMDMWPIKKESLYACLRGEVKYETSAGKSQLIRTPAGLFELVHGASMVPSVFPREEPITLGALNEP